MSGFKCSATGQEQSGAAECIDGDWRVPMGTADGTPLFTDSNGSVLSAGTALYVTFDGTNCGRGWSSSWYRTKNDPDFFDPYTEAISGSFGCTTCSGAQTGIAQQFFWEDDHVAICTFTGTGCNGNPDTNVCDAPDDDCAATNQICEKVSITSFTADNNHSTRVFQFDQVAGFKPHWYDSNTGLVPCTIVYTDSGTPANNYTRLGYAKVDGIDNSYSNTVRLWSGVTFVDQSGITGGEFTESGEPCSGTHGGAEACETPLLGSLGDMAWSYTQVSNECSPEPAPNCCGTSGCGYTGMSSFVFDDVDPFGSSPTYKWSMTSVVKTSSCEFTMTMDDISGNGGTTGTWYLKPDVSNTGNGKFTIEPDFLNASRNNSFITATFTNCDLVQSVNGSGDFSVACPISATFVDSGSC
ncbi:MAG: hypothetical protein ACR2NI_03065 [Pirellulales bacterium]